LNLIQLIDGFTQGIRKQEQKIFLLGKQKATTKVRMDFLESLGKDFKNENA